MPKIEKLSALLTQQIAAGEVITRPASVVKELLENSLDAGATQITLRILAGGKKIIQVEDNGMGIAADNLRLALSPYATSKIKHLSDLEQIESFGFRGEALASLTGVARVELISKPFDQAVAWKIKSEPGELSGIQPSAIDLTSNQGTVVTVKDLFYEIPARKKFLKSDRTEQLQIESIFKGLAIYYTHVQWRFIQDQEVHFQWSACPGDRLRRIKQIYGNKIAQYLCPIQAQSGDTGLTGWIFDLTQSYPSTEMQWIYVNGRVVRDRMIQHAIRQAIQMMQIDAPGLERGYLAYYVFLTIPTHEVDVNVHPMKQEVRFENSRAIYQLVIQAFCAGFQQPTKAPEPSVGFYNNPAGQSVRGIPQRVGSGMVFWDRFLFLESVGCLIDLNIYLKLFYIDQFSHSGTELGDRLPVPFECRYSKLSTETLQAFEQYFLKHYAAIKTGYRIVSIEDFERMMQHA